MQNRGWIAMALLLVASQGHLLGEEDPQAARPNIVVILADDLGYGDLGCYNKDSKSPPRTSIGWRHRGCGLLMPIRRVPSARRLAMRYLRVAMPGGRVCRRGVLEPWSPPLITPNRLTVASLLKQQGYVTGCIGKWHLGWEWPTKDGKPPTNGADNLSNVDFTKPIANGPTTRGFDFYFGTDVPNYPPFCFIENDRTVGIPTVPFGPRKGPALPGWDWVNVLPELTKQAVRFIESRRTTQQPFFLYFPLTSPHYPVVPAPEFQGKSGAGDFGDFVFQSDWSVGQVLDVLNRAGVTDNTLVIFTSDNGPEISNEVHPGAYDRIQQFGHASMGELRGAKRDTWEGGHRVPFLVRWPGRIKPGSVSEETICHVDLMATVAMILGVPLFGDTGVDSHNLLPAFLGKKPTKPIRETTIHHSGSGKLVIRQGDWVLISAAAGDDNGRLGEPEWFKKERGYTVHDQPAELYNLRQDPSQRHNVYADNLALAAEMSELLRKSISEGRSTPGPKQVNDVPVVLDKSKQ